MDFAAAALADLMVRVFEELRPKPRMSPLEWVEKYRYLSAEENPDYAGPFTTANIPALRGVLAACVEPGVSLVVNQKSAQIAYTAGVVCSVLAYYAHWRPCVQVVMFPREKSAKDFDAEKFAPMVRATPALSEIIQLKSRALGNSQTRKQYPGGLIKLVASNSPSDVKSTSAKVIIVEEPDDTNRDVKGQGNSITLLRERGKTIRESFMLIGGTPTAKGASEIEKEMRTTDQRRFFVACPYCHEKHALHWKNVHIPGFDLTEKEIEADPEKAARYPRREVYGRARFEDAYYSCPACGVSWTEPERLNAIHEAAAIAPLYGWEPTRPEGTSPGFYLHELLSVFPGSSVPAIAQKYLKAQHALEQGDVAPMIAFTNSSLGECWEYKGELPEEDELRARTLPYEEWTVPAGGLIPLMAVDVQHDRLAVTVWVIGRDEEMWLAFWGEIHGMTIVPGQGAWLELAEMMQKTVRHASGAALAISGVAIDCSDGQTSDAVYAFVRKHHQSGRPVIAVKGASDSEGRLEIWRPPKPIDPAMRPTKASRFGVQVHIVGTAKAKDLILGWAEEGGRVRLKGDGAGRMHWYEGVREDFYEQMLSEIKIPDRNNPRRRVWKHRTDRRNEALDCTVYAFYLSRHMRLPLWRQSAWDTKEANLRQPSIAFPEPDEAADDEAPEMAVETATADPPAAPANTTAAAVLNDFLAKRRGRYG